MREKPLNVQVAEVLGWSQLEQANPMDLSDPYRGYPPKGAIVGQKELVPSYDTDWSATGLLIAKYEIWLKCDKGMWIARTDIWPDLEAGKYTTPLLSVCHLLLNIGEKVVRLDP